MDMGLNAIEGFLERITESGAQDANTGVRYDIDAASFDLFDGDVQKDIKAIVADAEYAMRLLARKDEEWRSLIDASIDNVIVRAGTNAAGDRDAEIAKAEQAEKAAKRALRPNDPNYSAAGTTARHEHFVQVRREDRNIILFCPLKNAAHASAGAFDIKDRLAAVIKPAS